MFALLLICFVVRVSSTALDSHCLDIEPVETFNISGIGNGEWYEVARYPYPGERIHICFSYAAKMNGDLYTAETTNVDRNSSYYYGVIGKTSPDANGSGRVLFSLINAESQTILDAPFGYILAVDYDKYFVPYSCSYDEVKNEVTEFAWILSRTKPTPGKSREEFKYILEESRIINEDKLIWFDYETCADV